MNENNNNTLTKTNRITYQDGVYFSIFFTNTIVSSSPMLWKDYMNSMFPRSSSKTCKREIKMGNHGGSPPMLGLKEATLELGEISHKWLHAFTFTYHV